MNINFSFKQLILVIMFLCYEIAIHAIYQPTVEIPATLLATLLGDDMSLSTILHNHQYDFFITNNEIHEDSNKNIKKLVRSILKSKTKN